MALNSRCVTPHSVGPGKTVFEQKTAKSHLMVADRDHIVASKYFHGALGTPEANSV